MECVSVCIGILVFFLVVVVVVVVVVALKPFSLLWLANRKGAWAHTTTFSMAIVSLLWIGS